VRKHLFIIIIITCSFVAKSQNLNNLRTLIINISADTIQLDSLSIVPGSEILLGKEAFIIPDSLYHINYSTSLLITSRFLRHNYPTIQISYRVLPNEFSSSLYSRKKENTVFTGPVLFKASTYQNTTNNFFADNELNKRGSIARGITIGNNQDAVINSNLNLQLSGNIGSNMQMMAAISDENIPIQPDGNSQQIQEFDKVFIQLYNDQTNLIAGDFEIYKPTGYFMNVNKKAQGGLLNTKFNIKKKKNTNLETTLSGAVSKGKFCRKKIQGQEGNQGPYKLTGCENEQYIIILAGTEKVYIDGKNQTRGKENDYTIDYNTGEITFTANQPITKDSRITVEFEYSERSYARFLIYSTNTLTTDKGKVWVNVYSEQDSKNQPVNQELTSQQKQLLSDAGDNIAQTFVPNIDSVEFRSDYVLYEKIDTIVNNTSYTIYQYSTDENRAFYQVGFSLVGENGGNYIQVQNGANGRVYQWSAPISGVPQGNYEPVRLLVTPKKQQMLTLGTDYNLSNFTSTFFEIALSNYDLNTFSPKDATDNTGYAIKFNLNKHLLKADTLKNLLSAQVDYQLVNRHFTAIERFRTVEFERNWNLDAPFKTNEHLASVNLKYKHKKMFFGDYTLALLKDNLSYKGYKHIFNTQAGKSGYNLRFNSSILNTTTETNSTQFIRYTGNFSKSFKVMEVGVENEMEQNEWKNNLTDSLTNNSFHFTSYRLYIQNKDSIENRYLLSYKLRDDFLPHNNTLKKATSAEDFQVGFGLFKNPASILQTKVTYRKLEISDTSLIKEKEENTITGRVDYTLRILKGAITASTFYEAGSGLEPKREYSYLKVAPGQGVYYWQDYNNNGTAELDEFETAQFQDQANYIRVYRPSSEYIKIYKNEFSQILNLRPEIAWRTKKGFKKVLSKFSNSLAYRVNQKSTDDILEHSLNPFYLSQKDSTLITLNQSIRNTFSFNRSSSKFGVDYIFQSNSNKILLSSGFDQREKLLNGLKLRWNFISDFILQNYFEIGYKEYSSEFFSSKNYDLAINSNALEIQYEPGFKTKIELNYTYTQKENTLGSELNKTHNIGAELNYRITKKGNLLVRANFINIDYNSDANTSIAYEMLQGLKPGNNATWSLLFQRKLAGFLEMNFIYDGRSSESTTTIHTGSIQLRAFF